MNFHSNLRNAYQAYQGSIALPPISGPETSLYYEGCDCPTAAAIEHDVTRPKIKRGADVARPIVVRLWRGGADPSGPSRRVDDDRIAYRAQRMAAPGTVPTRHIPEGIATEAELKAQSCSLVDMPEWQRRKRSECLRLDGIVCAKPTPPEPPREPLVLAIHSRQQWLAKLHAAVTSGPAWLTADALVTWDMDLATPAALSRLPGFPTNKPAANALRSAAIVLADPTDRKFDPGRVDKMLAQPTPLLAAKMRQRERDAEIEKARQASCNEARYAAKAERRRNSERARALRKGWQCLSKPLEAEFHNRSVAAGPKHQISKVYAEALDQITDVWMQVNGVSASDAIMRR